MKGAVVWITGLPRSGKSTLAGRLVAARRARGELTLVLDGDELRSALVPTPGYDPPSRDGFYATLGRLAALLAKQGAVVLVPATAHRRAYREAARALAPRFIEVYVTTSAEECARRDPGGLYRSAARPALPGAGLAYEEPLRPDVTARDSEDRAAIARVLSLIERS